MAIIKVIDQHQERRGAWSLQNGRNYQVQVRVQCNSRTDGPYAVIQALIAKDIKYGAPYRYPVDPTKPIAETDPESFITSIAVEEQGNDGQNSYWLATLTYEQDDGTLTGVDPVTGKFDPFAVPPEINWSFAKYQKSQAEDTAGNPYINKAGDPLMDVPPADDSRPVLTYVRNEPGYDVSLVTMYKDKINSLVWNGFPPKTVKIQQLSGKKVYSTDVLAGWYWQVTYEFEVAPDTWTLKLANAGLTEVKHLGDPANPSDHKPILINNVPVSAPVSLNSSGRYTPNTIMLLDFEPYEAVDFTPLGITGITG